MRSLYRGAGGAPLEHPGEDSHLVGLAALGGVARLTRAAPVQIPLQIRRREFEPGGAAVDDGALGRAVALAEAGDGEEFADGIA